MRIIRVGLRYLKRVLMINALILVLVGVVCWFLDWRGADEYGAALIWVGAGSIILGTFSVLGNWTTTRDFDYQMARSVSDQDIPQRTQQDVDDVHRSYSFQILATAVGVSTIVIGWLIQILARSTP